MKSFPQKTYNKRNRVENVNYMLKNKYGDALKAYTTKGRRAEVTTKILAHNLWARLKARLYELFNNACCLDCFSLLDVIIVHIVLIRINRQSKSN